MPDLLDRYKAPRHRGRPEGAGVTGRAANPLCGDEATVWLRVGTDGRIEQAGWDAVGCMITHGAADLLCEAAVGRTVDEVAAWDREAMAALAGQDVPDARATCLVLAVRAVRAGARP